MNKKLLFIILPFIFFSYGFTQSIGIGTTTPNASSILDIKSNNKGVLLPRTSTTSRNAIVNPAKGLLLYDTTTSGFWFHSGSAWAQLSGAGNGWSLTGNAGINPATNFIGTTDNQPLRFRVNNAWAGEIHPSNGNVFFGIDAGASNTGGQSNTAIGIHSLFSNTNGYSNTANGNYALSFNSTGFENTANGSGSLFFNTIGNDNTAMGVNAVNGNTTASQNTGIGNNALFSQSFSNGGTAWISGNTAIGYAALYANQPTSTSDGINNTAVGNLVLTANTTGWDNTGIGVTALYTNTTGIENTAIGRQSLFYNTNGSDNTATGYKALRNNTTGSYNTVDGPQALYSNTSGNFNTAIGGNALFNNISGSLNIAIGYNSGTTGVNAAALFNTISIGNYGAFMINASNVVGIGNENTTFIGGNVPWSVISDARVKNTITEDVIGLDFILKLRPVTYHINSDAITTLTGSKKTPDYPGKYDGEKIKYSGFLAQEVEQACKDAGYDFSGYAAPKNQWSFYTLSYEQFVVPLVKAVQEQQVLIEKLTKQVEQNEKPAIVDNQQLIIAEFKKQITEMKNEIELLKKKN